MKHQEYKRIVPNANTAVLLIHGIAGTPNHFSNIIDLIPKEFSVYNMLLDGHGGSVKDFSKTSMKKWETQVELAVDELVEQHERIFIVAHSMGCLFAIEQAIRCPKVAEMFLLAVPLKLFIKPQMFSNCIKVYFDKINPKDLVANELMRCYGIDKSKNIFEYLGWIPRYLELFKKISDTKKLIDSVNINTVVFQSNKDEMVSRKVSMLLKKNSVFNVQVLKDSRHFYYSPKDLELIINTFEQHIAD